MYGACYPAVYGAYSFRVLVVVGVIPSELAVSTDLRLYVANNDGLTCYEDVLLTIHTLDKDAGLHKCSLSEGLCGFIAATDIASKSGYDEWSCTTSMLVSTDPCDSGNEWTGLTCSGIGDVVAINVNAAGISGTLPTGLGGMTTLDFVSMTGNSLSGEKQAL